MPRPFPWKCRNCGNQSVKPVVVNYSTEMDHDGRSYSLTVPNLEILECEACQNRTLPDGALARVISELRVKADLLTPEEIRGNRRRLGLTQEQLAAYLRVAKETVSRWESGKQIPQRAMSDFMRSFFDVPELREYLRRLRGLPPAGWQIAQTSVAICWGEMIAAPVVFGGGLSVTASVTNTVPIGSVAVPIGSVLRGLVLRN
jgi:putative zinc finger/helix-turn-helix YgiT family protein